MLANQPGFFQTLGTRTYENRLTIVYTSKLGMSKVTIQQTPVTATISEHIQITPGVCGGKPRITGHRIRVQDIVIWYEHLNMSPDEIVYYYPSITLADIHAALAYYYDHLDETRQDIRESEAFTSQLAAQTPSILQRKLTGRVDQEDMIGQVEFI